MVHFHQKNSSDLSQKTKMNANQFSIFQNFVFRHLQSTSAQWQKKWMASVDFLQVFEEFSARFGEAFESLTFSQVPP